MFRLAIGILIGCVWLSAYLRSFVEDWWTTSSPRKRVADLLQAVGFVLVILAVLI